MPRRSLPSRLAGRARAAHDGISLAAPAACGSAATLLRLPSPASTRCTHDEEHRHHQQRQDHHRDHAAHHAGAERLLAGAAGAGRDRHRQHAADEGEAGHQDRAEAQRAGFDRRLDQRLALRAQILGEFDDEDGVLCRQADDGDQADGEIDVVRQAAHASRRSPRRRCRAAPSAAPRAEWSSSHRARRAAGTPPAPRGRAGTAPASPTAFPAATARSIR